MTLNEPAPRGISTGFAERLLEVIDSGRRTATYKLPLLLALLDLCARHADVAGRAPGQLYTRDIAEQVAFPYWPQVIPYLVPGASTAVELRQITLPRAAITVAVSEFRGAAVAAGAASWHPRQRLPGDYQVMLDHVEVTVAEQPLPRLQAVGSSDVVFPFLYGLNWGPRESFSPARLRRQGPRGPAVRLLPGAGDELLWLGPLIRPLVELHRTRTVAEINQVAAAELDLHRHLFGSDRLIPPKALRDGIAASISSMPSWARQERQVVSLISRLTSVIVAFGCGLVPQASSPVSVAAWVAAVTGLHDPFITRCLATRRLEHRRGLLLGHGAGRVARLHQTVLYNSLYLADDRLFVNQHSYGMPAAHAPVFCFRAAERDGMIGAYLDRFERVWDSVKPITAT